MPEVIIESTNHWHELRGKNIGSSDAATLFECNKWQSPYELWLTKHGLIPAKNTGNDRSSWGQRFETPIALGIAEDNGWVIRKAEYYQHPRIAGMGCTPDFIIESNEALEDIGFHGAGILEIKNLEDWGYFSEFTREEANHYIEVQIQHQLSCTDLSWAVLGYKLPGQTPATQFKTRDEEFIKILENKVVDFWNSTKPPSPDGSESATRAVKALYQRQQNKEIVDMESNNELPFLVGTLEGCKLRKKPLAKEIREIEEMEREAKNRIMALSGGAEVIKFSHGEIKINTVNRGAVAPCSFQQVSYKLEKEETL